MNQDESQQSGTSPPPKESPLREAISDGVNVQLAKKQQTDRLTVLTTVHFQQLSGQPFSVNCNFDYQASKEYFDGPYSRKVKITREYKPLEFGWWEPEDVGLILIENLEGQNLIVNPTQEEAKELADKVAVLSYEGHYGGVEIHPKRCTWDVYRNPEKLVLWTPYDKEPIICKVTIYPK